MLTPKRKKNAFKDALAECDTWADTPGYSNTRGNLMANYEKIIASVGALPGEGGLGQQILFAALLTHIKAEFHKQLGPPHATASKIPCPDKLHFWHAYVPTQQFCAIQAPVAFAAGCPVSTSREWPVEDVFKELGYRAHKPVPCPDPERRYYSVLGSTNWHFVEVKRGEGMVYHLWRVPHFATFEESVAAFRPYPPEHAEANFVGVPRPVTVNVKYTDAEVFCMLKGTPDRGSDTRWRLFTEGGIVRVYRSWTGYGVYTFKVLRDQQFGHWTCFDANVWDNASRYVLSAPGVESEKLKEAVSAALSECPF